MTKLWHYCSPLEESAQTLQWRTGALFDWTDHWLSLSECCCVLHGLSRFTRLGWTVRTKGPRRFAHEPEDALSSIAAETARSQVVSVRTTAPRGRGHATNYLSNMDKTRHLSLECVQLEANLRIRLPDSITSSVVPSVYATVASHMMGMCRIRAYWSTRRPRRASVRLPTSMAHISGTLQKNGGLYAQGSEREHARREG
jgi:hypothetical protein